MTKHDWKKEAVCLEYDTDLFFDKYENSETLRLAVDELCSYCPMKQKCFAIGVSQKEWGVWGGIYLEEGKISKEFNSHKTKQKWGEVWKNLTIF